MQHHHGLGCFAIVVAVVATILVAPAGQPAAAAQDGCPSGLVALTFDDGPDDHTSGVLDTLAEYQVPATFFVLGQKVDDDPSLTLRTAQEGHEVANHSYTHADFELLSSEEIQDEVASTDQAIRDAGVDPLELLRPPYGHWDGPGGRVEAAVQAVGYEVITWTYSPSDYEVSAEVIEDRVLSNLHADANILLHDGVPNATETIAALPGIIDGARDQGYCFGVLDGQGDVVERPIATFIDIHGNTHSSQIEAIADEGITAGCNPPSNTRYCPGDPVTREQMASFLVRALGLTERDEGRFVDVPAGSTHEADIERLAAADITRGCNPPTNDRFCPDLAVTRAEMASFLVRALGLTERDEGRFVDVPAGSTHEADIERLAAAGITAGCNPPTNDRYCPGDPVARDQMASFLARAFL